jgi:hypothetical protein
VGIYSDSGVSSCTISRNVIDDCGANQGIAIVSSGGNQYGIVHNTIYKAGSDGIRISGTMPAAMLIAYNILANNGQGGTGYGINNSSGVNTGNISLIDNSFYSNTSGDTNGFGDSPQMGTVDESSDPFVNAAAHDFTLVAGALSLGSAGSLFLGESYANYADRGALQKAAAGGSSTVLAHMQAVFSGGPFAAIGR